jgi:hypothetical protein
VRSFSTKSSALWRETPLENVIGFASQAAIRESLQPIVLEPRERGE